MANKRKLARSNKSERSLALPRPREESFDLELLRQMIELLEVSDVTRLSWRRGKEHLVIRRGAVLPPPAPSGPSPIAVSVARSEAPARTSGAPPAEARPPAPDSKQGQLVSSPFVGTFYRTPGPDQPPFVELGSVVRKGQVLCIIEAMKLMNEIESEAAGTVVEILAENGQPVEFGQPLFRIEPA